ncbi:MAG: nuclear transport factor 2 family protein [Lacibacter sp.]|nr:nuclear transport factor 2 family protein [Lacibacter sp.]
MKYVLTLSLTVLLVLNASAQSTEDSVKAVVNTMFTAMKNADSVALKNVFSEWAVLQTISRTKEGATMVRTENINAFATSIGGLTKGDADERIKFGAVHIDGALASVWTPYEFYFKGNFSHCGVNSFQLVRVNGVWKVQYIIDTRRKTDCK